MLLPKASARYRPAVPSPPVWVWGGGDLGEGTSEALGAEEDVVGVAGHEGLVGSGRGAVGGGGCEEHPAVEVL